MARFLGLDPGGRSSTEAHPKALLWLIGIAHRERTPNKIYLADLDRYITSQQAVSEHERDAALGALAAFAMISELDGWENLYLCECEGLALELIDMLRAIVNSGLKTAAETARLFGARLSAVVAQICSPEISN